MPELPEVQTTVNFLRRKALGRVFLDVKTDWEKIISFPESFEKFKKRVENKKIKDVYRKGKYIIFSLSDDYKLLIHQRMTGHLLFGEWERSSPWKPKIEGSIKADKFNRYIHLIFFLDEDKQIALSDLRKFARIKLDKAEKIEKELNKLGPDALEVSLDKFKELIESKNSPVKKVLLDQKLISGIGNIYANEILFQSRTDPRKRSKEMSEDTKEFIWKNMRKILKEAVKKGGTSISDYRKPDGTKGGFQNELKVYQQEECENCEGKIKRMKINNRGTYLCPNCQN